MYFKLILKSSLCKRYCTRDALTQNVLNGVTVTVTYIANETTNVLGKYILEQIQPVMFKLLIQK